MVDKTPKFINKYNQLIIKLKQHCFENTDSKKTALALTLGICIGIIPLLGITFITVTALGFIFRLNQFVLQTTHLLVSPLQVIFIPIFIKAGQHIFAPSSVHIFHNSTPGISWGFIHALSQFGHLIIYGLMTWLIFSAITGYLLYKFWLVILSSNMKMKTIK